MLLKYLIGSNLLFQVFFQILCVSDSSLMYAEVNEEYSYTPSFSYSYKPEIFTMKLIVSIHFVVFRRR